LILNPLPYGILSGPQQMAGGLEGHPCKDDISERKDDSGGHIDRCHAMSASLYAACERKQDH
jgi:hypothetical protein